MIKLQEKDKQELKDKVTAMETEVTTLKMDVNLHPTVSVRLDSGVSFLDFEFYFCETSNLDRSHHLLYYSCFCTWICCWSVCYAFCMEVINLRHMFVPFLIRTLNS